MKYNYLIITLFSFYMLPLYGQSNDYYSGKTEIISDQYSYKVKTNSLYVELRNIDNVLSESNWMQRDGITPMDYRASSFIKPSNPEAIYDIFRSLFNEDDIESLKQADGIVA